MRKPRPRSVIPTSPYIYHISRWAETGSGSGASPRCPRPLHTIIYKKTKRRTCQLDVICLGCGVGCGVGCRVWGGVLGVGCGVWGVGCEVWGVGRGVGWGQNQLVDEQLPACGNEPKQEVSFHMANNSRSQNHHCSINGRNCFILYVNRPILALQLLSHTNGPNNCKFGGRFLCGYPVWGCVEGKPRTIP